MLELRLWQLWLQLFKFIGLPFTLKSLRNQSQSRCRRPSSKYLVFPQDSVGIYKFWEGPTQDERDDRENILYFSHKKYTKRSLEKNVKVFYYFTVTFFHRCKQSRSKCFIFWVIVCTNKSWICYFS